MLDSNSETSRQVLKWIYTFKQVADRDNSCCRARFASTKMHPANYRMLALSDIMYRMYANVLRNVVTGWCTDKNKIPDTQHRFSALMHLPGCIQHSLILSKRMIRYLGKHHGLISSVFTYQPACSPSLKTSMTMMRVKQGCPLSPVLFSLYINDVDCLADNMQGAVTGASDVQITHMLHDLCLHQSSYANHPTELQIMLDRLHGYAQRKGLKINVSKSVVVHFNSKGNNVPTFTLSGAQLVRAESFKHLDRPHTMLWLTKAYALPASYPWSKAHYTQLLSDSIMPRSPATAYLPARRKYAHPFAAWSAHRVALDDTGPSRNILCGLIFPLCILHTQFQHLFSSAPPSSASRLRDFMNQAYVLGLAKSVSACLECCD
eukprot:1161088-Pelagomonas_calceolata.AAC.1